MAAGMSCGAYTLPAAVAPGGRVVLLAGAGVLLRRR